MKALRHISGILLATLGSVVMLGSISMLCDRDPDVPAWMAVVFLIAVGLVPLGGAFLLLRRTLTEPSCRRYPGRRCTYRP